MLILFAKRHRLRACLFAAGLACVPGAAAWAQAGDWPCVQRLVGKLEGGQMWAGPPLPAVGAAVPPETDALARELGGLQVAPEAFAGKLQAFARGADPAARAERLTTLFAVALTAINSQRGDIIEGIKRYARRQQQLAAKISADTRELDALERAAGSDPARVAEVRSARDWDARVHADRQRQLNLVCDQPVRLEQRAFALARAIQEQLP